MIGGGKESFESDHYSCSCWNARAVVVVGGSVSKSGVASVFKLSPSIRPQLPDYIDREDARN